MTIKIDTKYLIYFCIGFMLFTVIGTVSHEYGHLVIAELLGEDTALFYGSMTHNNPVLSQWYFDTYHANTEAITNGSSFPDKIIFNEIDRLVRRHGFLILCGGPLQTMLTGSIGFFILLYRRKNNRLGSFKFIDWMAIFLSLFWLRQVFNLVMSVSTELVFPNGSFFGGDERKIANYLDLWQGSVALPTASIGFIITWIVIFRYIPRYYRTTFILGGLIGGIVGYLLWFHVFGPILIPLPPAIA